MTSSALRLGCRRAVGRIHCHHPLDSLVASQITECSTVLHVAQSNAHRERQTTTTRNVASLSHEQEHVGISAGTSGDSAGVIATDKEESQSQSPPSSSQPSTAYTDPGFVPSEVMQNLAKAAQWNQGSDDSKWDPAFCRAAVDAYERHLIYLQRRLQEHPPETPFEQVILAPHLLLQQQQTKDLLSAETADMAMKAVLKGKMHTSELSKRVRQLERLIGSLGRTPLTDGLSLRLVEANGKSGNIGRVLSLLNLRSSRHYPPCEREFGYAVQAIESAGLFLREGRNILLSDALQPDIDNPTRWLDAILTNMHQRNHALSIQIANRMLNTYASTGRTSKALHFFYYISRQQQPPTVDPDTTTVDSCLNNDIMPTTLKQNSSIRVKMKFRPPPKYYKVPSESRDKLVAVPGEKERRLKLDLESDPNWSLALTAAFSFADSLTHGACGHPPIELDVVSWNTLIKACCYRGSLWRAMQLLKDTMPQQGIEPNTISYNTILAALARVGDTVTMHELFVTMNNKNVPIDKYTIEAMVDGMLNMGDLAGAITFAQDVFNQHVKLPPYTTHLKIIEFCLASDLVYEAKRHVYLLQQIWKWEPNEYHDAVVVRDMELTKKNPKLSKVSLQKLFAFFGVRLHESDFF